MDSWLDTITDLNSYTQQIIFSSLFKLEKSKIRVLQICSNLSIEEITLLGEFWNIVQELRSSNVLEFE